MIGWPMTSLDDLVWVSISGLLCLSTSCDAKFRRQRDDWSERRIAFKYGWRGLCAIWTIVVNKRIQIGFEKVNNLNEINSSGFSEQNKLIYPILDKFLSKAWCIILTQKYLHFRRNKICDIK